MRESEEREREGKRRKKERDKRGRLVDYEDRKEDKVDRLIYLSLSLLLFYRVSRLGQKAVLPIILSADFDLRLAFFGAIIPASVALAIDQWVLKPRRKRLIQQ